jgi:hypothetical protein
MRRGLLQRAGRGRNEEDCGNKKALAGRVAAVVVEEKKRADPRIKAEELRRHSEEEEDNLNLKLNLVGSLPRPRSKSGRSTSLVIVWGRQEGERNLVSKSCRE